MILLDSDHVSVLVDMRDARHEDLVKRLMSVREAVAIPVVVLEEHLRGWLALIHRITDPEKLVEPYKRIVELLSFFAEWEISPWTSASAAAFTRLRKARVRIGTHDLRIASIVLANDALLLSANTRDFEQVPNLNVEDWLHR